MQREVCGCCGSSDSLQTVLDLGVVPLADEFPQQPNLDQARFPLQLMACHACGLGQLSEIVDDDLLWGGDYAFYSGSSATIRRYYSKYAIWLRDNYGLMMRRGSVLEIACNDGTLLKELGLQGFDSLIGIDPALGPVNAARDRGLTVLNRMFDVDAIEEIFAYAEPPSLIVANNVAAHVADLDDFFGAIRLVLADHGAAIIEVQYLPDLLVGNDFPLLYHEHRYYHSLTSLMEIAEKHDLVVQDAWLTEPQGGSLRVDLRHIGSPYSRGQSVAEILRGERWLRSGAAFDGGLQGRADRIRDSLRRLIYAERQAGRVVAGYGASAKASTLLAWTGLDGEAHGLPWVVDTTPTKIGRFMPGTSIPVIERGTGLDGVDGPDTYLLMIYNYLGHIIRQESAWLDRKGHRMIVPLPKPVIL